MNYKFKKYEISSKNTPIHLKTFEYGVEVENKNFKTLELISSHLWTDNKIKDLIGVITQLNETETYEYQVEGGYLGLIIDSNEVAFFNLLDRKNENEDFVWSTEKFIIFMEAFKFFLAEAK